MTLKDVSCEIEKAETRLGMNSRNYYLVLNREDFYDLWCENPLYRPDESKRTMLCGYDVKIDSGWPRGKIGFSNKFKFNYDSLSVFNKEYNVVCYNNNTNWFDKIERVVYNDPATIVFWKDKTKTVVKTNMEVYDKEKGLLMCIAKKMCGNKGSFNKQVKKWTSEDGRK